MVEEQTVDVAFDPTADYHRYGLDRTADSVQYFVDGSLVWTVFGACVFQVDAVSICYIFAKLKTQTGWSLCDVARVQQPATTWTNHRLA
jgi:beta-glucanase (GH16 family)